MEKKDFQHIHLIAVGGSIMHNLALALHDKGLKVTGSDDEIYEPAKSRLAAAGLLPEQEGWFPEKLDTRPDAVILGMHARADNPELKRAQELNLPIYSFPEFIYEQSRDKQRVVIGGSHGKTTTTSMIMHVLQHIGRKFDYAVGAQLEGFDRMVKLSDDAPVIIIEGDEYLSDPIKRVPKFHLYHHHIAVITGISWDHINVFPDPELYRDQFRIFAEMTPKAGTLIYNQDDEQVQLVSVPRNPADISYIGYGAHEHSIRNGKTILHTKKEGDVEVQLFGEHNLRNLNAAKEVCKKIGVKAQDFYAAMRTFKGAAKRMQKLGETATSNIYRDFAHAPSKVKASTEAVKKQFPQRKLVAVLELHTFSSLNKKFIPQYAGALNLADEPIVYFSPKTIEHKRMEMLSEQELKEAFQNPNLKVYTDSEALEQHLLAQNWQNANLLLMSSGTYNNINLEALTQAVLKA
ncbi:UDP-N-acetylmuramate--L-alanine ligase [Pontibacter chinhatensis]|uniref:UDP-N-acetylmuramate: L-alanyl-gamma-D-glutamyl-meso-diaminopimelate ligase n=1 Tax=Pontibacter chinhatensis TaxID=1436961 RepID=A0A1I2QWV2_9BACT|nr:Mur ligase family protein [Pontibacter chinhatensis]SFG30131.1 UDP-N-acetylmuramate: L-alanyl-gamma-D-glutamyl-meso-diaminopimelate ligase [Pontibacter chinhatensis]